MSTMITKSVHHAEWNETVRRHNESVDFMRRSESHGSWKLQMQLAWGYGMPEKEVPRHYGYLGALQAAIGMNDMPSAILHAAETQRLREHFERERQEMLQRLQEWSAQLPVALRDRFRMAIDLRSKGRWRSAVRATRKMGISYPPVYDRDSLLETFV